MLKQLLIFLFTITFGLSNTLELSKNEQEWLKNHPIVKLAVMDYWESDELGNSFHSDFLILLSKYSNINFIPVKYSSWQEGYKDAIEGKNIYGIMNLAYSKERAEKFFDYTLPYSYKSSNLLVKETSPLNAIEELSQKSVIVQEDSIFQATLEKMELTSQVITKSGNMEDVLFELSSNENIHSALVGPIESDLLERFNLRILKKVYSDFSNVYIGVSKKTPQLQSIINKTIQIIPKEQLSALQNKKYIKIGDKNLINYTKEEKLWIKNNPNILVGVQKEWGPFDYVDEEGSHQGLSGEFLEYISNISGINFTYTSDIWQELLAKMKTKQIDLLPAIYKNMQREEYLLFSRSYLSLSEYIFTQKESKKIETMEDLFGKSVASVKGYDVTNWLQKNYPQINVIEKDSIEDSLNSVQAGEAFAYIGDRSSTHFVIDRYFINGIKANAIVQERDPLKLYMAVDKENKILASIINKSLLNIPIDDRRDIIDRWIEKSDELQTQEDSFEVVVSFFELLSFEEIFFALLIVMLMGIVGYMYFVKNNLLNIKIRTFNLFIITFELLTISFLIYEIVLLNRIDHELAQSHKEHFAMKDAADQLRQSSDDLTHFARAYVVTKDKKFFHQYKQIVAIRDGSLERPKNYQNIYWDLSEEVRKKTHPPQEKKSLDAIFKELPLGEKEKQLLRRSLLNSQNLVNLEEQAFDMVQNEQENAIELLFSKEYYATKHEIMEPIDKVMTLMGERMQTRTALLKQKVQQQFFYILVVSLLFIIGNFIIYFFMVRKVNKPIAYLTQTIQKIKNDEQDIDEKSFYTDEIGEAIDQFFVMHKHQKNIEDQIRSMHKLTQDSIEYASMIQHALIPEDQLFANFFAEHFCIWEPKDIVGGDIYLFEKLRSDDECLLLVIDCTGHGVPGAFVTMLVKAIERQIIANIVNSKEDVSPAKILSIFNGSMKHLLKQDSDESLSNAGFDGGIIYYNKKENVVKFAGAEVPLFYFDVNGELQTIQGDRHSIGYKKSDANYQFKDHSIHVSKGMSFYLSTDGFLDQNGGEKGFPFGKKRLKELLSANKDLPLLQQKEILFEKLQGYQGDEHRNDDITFVGFTI